MISRVQNTAEQCQLHVNNPQVIKCQKLFFESALPSAVSVVSTSTGKKRKREERLQVMFLLFEFFSLREMLLF